MGLVSWLILIPFLTALAILLTPNERRTSFRCIALGGTALHLILTGLLCYRYWTTTVAGVAESTSAVLTDLRFVERIPWFDSLGITYLVGVDGMSVFMVLLTSIVIFAGVLASWEVMHRGKEFFAWLMILVTGVFGVFMSFDLFLFFIFYELAVLPMYLLIGLWGTGPKEYAAMKLTMMLMASSALILVGILALYYGSGLQTFDLTQLATAIFPTAFQHWVFPVIFIGFGVIGALYPFHTWSPDGHASAPTAVSMLHAGVLMKLGGYGALRIGVYLLPEGAQHWALFFMVLTTVNILYGSFAAIKQTDLKYFTAYSSVSHCGFVLFGVLSLNGMGFHGAVLQMFSHGIMTALFFGLIGMVYGRTHTRVIPEMGGLGSKMPWLATCFFIGGLASLGLPGLFGFVAESHVFLGGIFGQPGADATFSQVLTLLATASIVVTAVYVLRGLTRVFYGPIDEKHFGSLTDATLTEKLSSGILVTVLVIGGLFPSYFVNLIHSSLVPLVNRVAQAGGQ
jgi:NADH-quinone oxidoreductase subunit M